MAERATSTIDKLRAYPCLPYPPWLSELRPVEPLSTLCLGSGELFYCIMEEHLCLALQMRTVDHFFSLAAHRGRCVNLGPTSLGIHAWRQFWNCIVVCEITKPRSSVPGQGCKDGSSKSTKLSCDHCGQRSEALQSVHDCCRCSFGSTIAHGQGV